MQEFYTFLHFNLSFFLALLQVLDIVMFWKFNLLTTHIDTLLDKEVRHCGF